MITLVGCGFLGSLFAEEMAKIWFAFEERTPFRLIDFDKVEERNAANQGFTLKDAGRSKSGSVAMRLRAHNVPVTDYTDRVDKLNAPRLLDGTEVLVSAVDNLPTRRLLWFYAREHRIPLLNLGVSQAGTGNVEWTVGKAHDSWSLSPLVTLGQTKKLESIANTPKELKPCELIAFRGLGLNTAVAAAKSLAIFKGFDPANSLTSTPLPGTVTVWDSTNTSHTLRSVHEEVDVDG